MSNTDDLIAAAREWPRDKSSGFLINELADEIERLRTDYDNPNNRFVSWETDADPVDLEAEINHAVADCINRIEVFSSPDRSTFILRLEATAGTGDPFVRHISFPTIRAAFDELEWDNAEEHAELLATRFEELAAALRNGKGTYGDRSTYPTTSLFPANRSDPST